MDTVSWFFLPYCGKPSFKVEPFSSNRGGSRDKAPLPVLKIVQKGGHNMGPQVSQVIGPHLRQISGSTNAFSEGVWS